MSLETPVLLAMAGVKIAICTDHPETPVQYLPLCAAMAVKGGLPRMRPWRPSPSGRRRSAEWLTGGLPDAGEGR